MTDEQKQRITQAGENDCEFDGMPLHPHHRHFLVKAGFKTISEIESITEEAFQKSLMDAFSDREHVTGLSKCAEMLKKNGVRFAANDDVLSKPLEVLGLSKDALEIIEGSTRCEVVGDLWRLSAKELCVLIGLNAEQVSDVLKAMEAVSANLPPRYSKHIQRCKNIAMRYGIEFGKNKGKREMKLDQETTILQTIISEHGYIWENPKMTKALFMDYYPNDKPLWHALLSCIDESIPNEIQGMDSCSRTDYYRFVRRLTNECGYLEELAEKAVSTWIYAIGIPIEETSTESGSCSDDTPIEEIELSVRSYNALKRAGINSVGDLTRKKSEDDGCS